MAKTKRGFIKYKSYLFTTRDPILEVITAARSQQRMKFATIHKNGGPTPATLRNWESGKTRRPQFCTIAAASRTLGKRGIMFGPKGAPYLVD